MSNKRKKPANRMSIYLHTPKALQEIVAQEGIVWKPSVFESVFYEHYLTNDEYINNRLRMWYEGKISVQEAVASILTYLYINNEEIRESMAEYFAQWCFDVLLSSEWAEEWEEKMGDYSPDNIDAYVGLIERVMNVYIAEIKMRETLKKNPKYADVKPWEIPISGMAWVKDEDVFNSKTLFEQEKENVSSLIKFDAPYKLINTLWSDWRWLYDKSNIFEVWEQVFLCADKITDNTAMRKRFRESVKAFLTQVK